MKAERQHIQKGETGAHSQHQWFSKFGMHKNHLRLV